MCHADILRQIPDEPDPLIHCLHFCTWMVSGFHMGPRSAKKPYNALLGEVFRAALQGTDGNVIGTFIAEQVCHHPPITAFRYNDRPGRLSIWGHAEMRSRFYGNSVAALMDHENTRMSLEVPGLGETYDFNFPDLYGRGIIIRPLVYEIVGTVRVRCAQSGVVGQIKFHSKPILWGRYHCFSGHICPPGSTTPTITFEGRWSAFMKVVDHRNDRTWLSFDVRVARPLTVVRPPIDDQSELESESVWRMVTQHLIANDLRGATAHKAALEEKQRKERAFFEQAGLRWEPQYFHYSQARRRWIPNEMNSEPYREGEEIVAMPPPFTIPPLIQRAYDAGITEPMAQVHINTEANIRARA
jgi:hypothetical protein